jgi:hypothetical protein
MSRFFRRTAGPDGLEEDVAVSARHPGASSAVTAEKPTAVETISTIVLAIAAVATAWSAYQSTRWNGVMATEFNEASSLRSESVRRSTAAGQYTVADVTIAADWLSAALSDNDAVARELRLRMSPELDAAMKAWLGDWQLDQPVPPGSPFTDGRYQARGSSEAADLEAQAETKFAEGRNANQHSDNYVLTGVIFALTLFFAAIADKVAGAQYGKAMLVASLVLMTIGVALLVVQPKSIGV